MAGFSPAKPGPLAAIGHLPAKNTICTAPALPKRNMLLMFGNMGRSIEATGRLIAVRMLALVAIEVFDEKGVSYSQLMVRRTTIHMNPELFCPA